MISHCTLAAKPRLDPSHSLIQRLIYKHLQDPFLISNVSWHLPGWIAVDFKWFTLFLGSLRYRFRGLLSGGFRKDCGGFHHRLTPTHQAPHSRPTKKLGRPTNRRHNPTSELHAWLGVSQLLLFLLFDPLFSLYLLIYTRAIELNQP